MSPYTVTPALQKDMPRHHGLLRRGSRWYLNIKVPKDLKDALGKEHVRVALKTSDYREATRAVDYERTRWRAEFDNQREKLAGLAASKAPKKPRLLTVLSEKEAFQWATRFLVSKEKEFRQWMDSEGKELVDCQLAEVASTLSADEYHLSIKDDSRGNLMDGTTELQHFLKEQGIECAPTSPAFKTLLPMAYRAQLEFLGRAQDLVNEKPVHERDNAFRGINAYSPAMEEASNGYTVDDLISLKEKANQDLNRRIKTVDAFKHPARLLREVLGGDKLLSSLTRDDMDRVFAVMKQMPLNVTQRYKGMTFAQAIEAAKRAGDDSKPAQNTNWATYHHILAAFRLAVDEKYMTENPADSRLFKQMFKKGRAKQRSQFTIEELNKLFRAPLYTGCVDDFNNYYKRGDSRPRRGRFWVPLLALFHGMRNNEACQIYTNDVRAAGGVHYIAIREDSESDSGPEKRLKTGHSIRETPIHPELIRIGFLEFVESRKQDKSSPLLFPELTPGHKGYFSDAFSKWFTRFVKKSVGLNCSATLHSFRHQFRDATRAARLSEETVGRLAGWDHGQGQSGLQMHQYGRGPEYLRLLAEELAKVEYPGLDLTHLYPSKTRLRE